MVTVKQLLISLTHRGGEGEGEEKVALSCRSMAVYSYWQFIYVLAVVDHHMKRATNKRF